MQDSQMQTGQRRPPATAVSDNLAAILDTRDGTSVLGVAATPLMPESELRSCGRTQPGPGQRPVEYRLGREPGCRKVVPADSLGMDGE